jgi:hypothetical protein
MAPMRRAIRTAAVLLSTASVAVGSAFAPEHIHERDGQYQGATIHRHLAPHHARALSEPTHIDDDDDDHGQVIWLSATWRQAAAYHGPSATTTAATWNGFAPSITQWSAVVLDDAAPPHGPPRTACSPRAPPFPA